MKPTNIHLTCEYQEHPMGIEQTPRISWRYQGADQTAYQILITRDTELKETVYDSGRSEDSNNLLIPCEFPMESKTRYYYRVRVYTKTGWSDSDTAWFETGLLDPSDFNAQWITAPGCEAPLFQKKFHLQRTGSARLYICGLGFYEANLNGKQIGDRMLDPVWSDYEHRDLSKLLYPISDDFSHSTYYVIHDVTDMLREGENTLTVLLGNGWYNQHERNIEGILHYGNPKLFCKLCVDRADILLSNESWQWQQSPILFNNVYYGERYDARLEGNNSWNPAKVLPAVDTVMRAQLCPPDRIIRKITPKLVQENNGLKLYDMGINSTGRVKIQTSAQEGTSILIRHAEEIKPDGSLDYTSAGGEKQIQQDEYISNGKAGQQYAARFCVHGFRYFEVEGEAEILSCEIIHADVKPVGNLETSDPVLNWIIEAYQNAQESNLHCGVPSDCPHRERLGYTGDGQVTADTAMYFWEMSSFYAKWMRDIADCQCRKSGHVQHTAPFYGGGGGPGGWGCAMILLPWKYYLHYGDRRMLVDYYDSMHTWMGYLSAHSEDFLLVREEQGGWCLGDWCVEGKMALTESYVNSYFYAKCADIMTRISTILGHQEGVSEYSNLSDNIKDSICRHFFHPQQGMFDQGKQGANAFAAELGLCDEKAVNQLIEYYADTGHFDTGIFGTPILTEILCEMGSADLAFKLLSVEGKPGFSEWRKKGATTLHESWDSHDSHNHPMFGGVVGVIMRRFAGIQPDPSRPGFRHIQIKPCFVKGLKYVKANTITMTGEVFVEWRREADGIRLEIIIPSNATASLILQNRSQELTYGKHSFLITDQT